MTTETIEQRFWKYVKKTDTCWNFCTVQNNSGYSGFGFGNKKYAAHRFSYELHIGKIPEGYFVLHKCDNPRCVNPEHLWIGTQFDNMRDASKKGRMKNCFRWTISNNPHLPMSDRNKKLMSERKQKQFCVMSPSGKYITGVNLRQFCFKHGLNQGGMWSVIHGKIKSHKGYTQYKPS